MIDVHCPRKDKTGQSGPPKQVKTDKGKIPCMKIIISDLLKWVAAEVPREKYRRQIHSNRLGEDQVLI